MVETMLFVFFLALAGSGGYLVWKRTGNYDADFILKTVGWVLLLIGTLGLLESFRVI